MPSSLLDQHFGAYLGCSSAHEETHSLTSATSSKKSSHKRKKPSRASSVKGSSADEDMENDEERKRAKRRSQNRVSAQISREKKRLYVQSLEKRVRALEKKNAQLNKTITTLLNNQEVTTPMSPASEPASEYMTAENSTSSDYTPSPPPSPPMEPAAVPPPPPPLEPPVETRNLQEVSIDEPAVLLTQQSAVLTSVFSQIQMVLVAMWATTLWAMVLSYHLLPSKASSCRPRLLKFSPAPVRTASKSKVSTWTSTSTTRPASQPRNRPTASIPPGTNYFSGNAPPRSKLSHPGRLRARLIPAG